MQRLLQVLKTNINFTVSDVIQQPRIVLPMLWQIAQTVMLLGTFLIWFNITDILAQLGPVST